MFSNNERGFSMVEIVVVGIIMAILVAIAVPSTIKQMRAYRLDSAVATVTNKLMETRMNAIKRNRTCWLLIDKGDRSVQIRSSTPTNVVINIEYPDSFAPGTNLDAAGSVEVAFDSMGRYSSGPTTVVMLESSSTKRKNITISPAGKISIGSIY